MKRMSSIKSRIIYKFNDLVYAINKTFNYPKKPKKFHAIKVVNSITIKLIFLR